LLRSLSKAERKTFHATLQRIRSDLVAREQT
jgi:hypothetical protein